MIDMDSIQARALAQWEVDKSHAEVTKLLVAIDIAQSLRTLIELKTQKQQVQGLQTYQELYPGVQQKRIKQRDRDNVDNLDDGA